MAVSRQKQIFDALAPVRDEFELRHYRWALADAKREVAEDFRLIRLDKSALSFWFVQFAEKLNNADRLSLLAACVKRVHPRAMELTGDRMMSIEQDLYNKQTTYLQTSNRAGLWPIAPDARAKINKKEFRKFLRANLKDRGLGDFDPWGLPAEWRYRLKIGDWTVETYIDTGGSFRQVGYVHSIKGPEDVSLFPHYLSSGLGAGSSEWDMLTDKDLPHAADDIVALARHFVDAMPELLAGLEPPVV